MDASILLGYPRAASLYASIDPKADLTALAETYARTAVHTAPDRDIMLAIEVHIRMCAQLHFELYQVRAALSTVEKALEVRQKLDKAARAKQRRAAKKAA